MSRIGCAEYDRDNYKRALEAIIAKADEMRSHDVATQGGLDGWNAAEADGANRCAEIARAALTTPER